jgi:class 3 adenylate cyclase
MQSSAGRCFRTGRPYTSPNPKIDPQHYGKADLVSNYQTEDMLNYPLKQGTEVIGVLQLLNKEGQKCFVDDDIPIVERLAVGLAAKVSYFVRAPENLEILGIISERDTEYATVMFCDLTRSSALFQELNVSAAIQHINEYFDRICDVGLKYGATVDKYIGDGVLLRFNVPRPVRDHPFKAVTAAFEMKAAFEKLKSEWITMGEPLMSLYIRIGIAYGEINEAVVGHPQYQYVTIFGQPVNIAINLCEAAVRDRTVIILDEQVHKVLSDQIQCERLPRERLGKAVSYIESAYELQGLIS